MDKAKYLSRINLFDGLDSEELKRIESVTPVEFVKKGTLITTPHAERKRLYLVKSGIVRLYQITGEGKELTIDLMGAGHLFGEIASFAAGDPHTYAVTVEDAVICSIDHVQFRQVMTERPELALRFIEIISARLKEVEELLERMTYGSVRQRLLYLLYKLSEKFKRNTPVQEEDAGPSWVRLEVELTHQELASMAGSIRETVTAMMNELAAEGIVRKEGPRKRLWLHADRLQAALAAE
ncbi:Crp/Fnr family transcriptional regulator [Paenibacillus melissococcoides]|uniref:Crp/Fnr family transcriptional regulator n=1 Tax=Paenibacillus melissococcoides TaxID=2912268 RepID=A0ABN8UJ15_9BACL|nr:MULTISPECIES: Crp/Fnr family transcriptional regulator [Paenibacillus]MEB9895827.1 Crp/Fnr family transcriptional regulator [Bacillus cereus]CAH8249629.1 Crp/Fnr family transcriptional regulator [Paenibacillus melissococcoides]CAH8721422.1 Crp/Fnr family transcriptional regulator [Paenibacillus melissococcoides]CAH8721798.1 Crp/Fnr family transcriptional regulator [Paenibacillus melissococcoides]GIO80745.1 transcriptional regulator SdrP [Paenibacillus dendritiformis]